MHSSIKEDLSELSAPLGRTEPDGDLLSRSRSLELQLSTVIAQAESYTHRLESLMGFSSILNSSLDSSRVREAAMKATCDLLGSEGATLYLVDENAGELCFEAIVGQLSSDQLRDIRLPIDDTSIAGLVASKRVPVLVNDVAASSFRSCFSGREGQLRTRSVVSVPVESKGRLLGVLQACNKFGGAFSDVDQRLLEALAHQVAIAVENALLYENLKDQFQETVMAMVTAIEAKDRYTGGHTRRVALFSELIARHMGLSEAEIQDVRLSAILHDVGKIGVDDQVLKKQAPLDQPEWEHMKKHPDMGWKILANVKSMKHIADGMRFHHERPDGLGYPLGLKGEQIPLIARIIAVADTFDAMTSNRPYRKGLDYHLAYEEILRNRGTQFCEKVVDGFVRAFKMERMGKKRLKSEIPVVE